MKTTNVLLAFIAACSVEATSVVTVQTCVSCSTTVNDMVTRTDEPVPSCTVAPILPGNMTVSTGPSGTISSGSGVVSPTAAPTGGAGQLIGANSAVAAAIFIAVAGLV